MSGQSPRTYFRNVSKPAVHRHARGGGRGDHPGPVPAGRPRRGRRRPAGHRARRRPLLRGLRDRQPRRGGPRRLGDAGGHPDRRRRHPAGERMHELGRLRAAVQEPRRDAARRLLLLGGSGRARRRWGLRADVARARPDRRPPVRRRRGGRRRRPVGAAGHRAPRRPADGGPVLGAHRRRGRHVRRRRRLHLPRPAGTAADRPAGDHHVAVERPRRGVSCHPAAQLRRLAGRQQRARQPRSPAVRAAQALPCLHRHGHAAHPGLRRGPRPARRVPRRARRRHARGRAAHHHTAHDAVAAGDPDAQRLGPQPAGQVQVGLHAPAVPRPARRGPARGAHRPVVRQPAGAGPGGHLRRADQRRPERRHGRVPALVDHEAAVPDPLDRPGRGRGAPRLDPPVLRLGVRRHRRGACARRRHRRLLRQLPRRRPAGLADPLFGPNYRRLQEVKGRWDPTDQFHHAQSVRPPGR